VRNGGTIIVFASVSSYNGAFANNDIYYRELTVMGSYSASPPDIKESLDLINHSIIKVDKLSEVYKLEDINQAVSDTLSNRILKAYISINSAY
jgi:D-arabinose 1-dehydrogenase-like Zn-dependent alcohol dehydrogenase